MDSPVGAMLMPAASPPLRAVAVRLTVPAVVRGSVPVEVRGSVPMAACPSVPVLVRGSVPMVRASAPVWAIRGIPPKAVAEGIVPRPTHTGSGVMVRHPDPLL